MIYDKILTSIGRRLEGKVAVITGGAAGIGKTTAKLFSQQGCRVVIADIQDELGHSVCEEIGPNMATFVHCDVTKEEDVNTAVDEAVTRFGKLDIMFNNAGTIDPPKTRIMENDRSDFERVLGVNVTGVFLGTKHAARVMLPAKQGSIINNGSVSSIVGGIASHAYVASKHAVVGLTKNAAAELGEFGIRVNCLSAFAIESPFIRNVLKNYGNDEIEKRVGGLASLKGPTLTAQDIALTAQDIAEAAVYFGSDESRCVFGHNFVLDGAFTVANTALEYLTVEGPRDSLSLMPLDGNLRARASYNKGKGEKW